jgi:hypothetical protein
MGLIERAAEHLSTKSAAALLVVGYGLYVIVSRQMEERKLRKLPGVPHGQKFRATWPLGRFSQASSFFLFLFFFFFFFLVFLVPQHTPALVSRTGRGPRQA